MEQARESNYPIKSLVILIMIGIVDLVATAVLHAQGRIVELNPVMRPFIEHSEWSFAAVKGTTLVLAFYTMMNYARQNREFVRKASRLGILMYVGIWLVWFTAAM
jgi:hypothetical protein